MSDVPGAPLEEAKAAGRSGRRLHSAALSVFLLDGMTKGLMGGAALLTIRVLPSAEYAAFTVVLAVISVVVQVMATSINRIYILSLDSSLARSAMGLVLCVQVGIGTLAMLVVAVGWNWEAGLFASAALCTAGLFASELLRSEYQRQLAFRSYSLVDLGRAIIFVGLLVIAFSSGLLKAEVVVAMQGIAAAAIAVPLLVRMNLFGERLRTSGAAPVVHALFSGHRRYIWGYFCAIAVLGQIDVFMLAKLSSDDSVATYGSAFRYYSLFLMTLSAVHVVLLPSIPKQSVASVVVLLDQYRKVAWVLIGIALALTAAAPRLVPLLDGGRYPGAVPVFQVLMLGSIVSILCSPHSNVLIRYERHTTLFKLACFAIVAAVGMNSLLIPDFGPTGAAVATACVFGACNGFIWWESRKILRRNMP